MNGNLAYQTPGQYRVFFMDQSSIVINALSQYDAKQKTQAANPGKMVLRAQLICRTQTAYQTSIPIKTIEVKAKAANAAVKTINLDI
jgi:hypothetical protein